MSTTESNSHASSPDKPDAADNVDAGGRPWQIVLATLLVGLILAVAGLLIQTVTVVLLVFTGVLFAVFLHGITSWITARVPLTYHWTYTLVVALLVAAAVGGSFYMGSQIATHISELSTQLQLSSERLTEQLDQYDWARPYLPNGSQMQNAVSDDVLPSVWTGVQSTLWAVTGLVVIICVGLYVAYDPSLYINSLVKVVPIPKREHFRDLLRKIGTALGYWILGRLLSMCVVGVLTSIGLWLLDVPLPITLGVLAALLSFIPNIGPILAAVPQALLALQIDTSTVLYVLLLNVALQTIESYLLTPLIQQYELPLPAALAICVQVLMGTLFGLIGVVTAAPLAAATIIAVQVLYIGDYLNDPQPGELDEGS